MNRSVRFLFGSVPVPAVRFLVLVPPVPVLTGAGSGLPVRTAALLVFSIFFDLLFNFH